MLAITINRGSASRIQIHDSRVREERLTWQAGRSIWVANGAVTKSDSLATLQLAVKEIEDIIIKLETQAKEETK